MSLCDPETVIWSRSPRGERGLKLVITHLAEERFESLPARGAWIETRVSGSCWPIGSSRSPRGERGLKPRTLPRDGRDRRSLPARGAWIETCSADRTYATIIVAPRAGSVD